MLLEALDFILPPAHWAVKPLYLLLLLLLLSVTQSCPTLSNSVDSSMPGLPCPSLSPGVSSNSCQLTQRCHPTISSCHPLILLPVIFASIGAFSKESALSMFSRTFIKLVVFVLSMCAEWRLVFSNPAWWFSQCYNWSLLKSSTNLLVKLSLGTTRPSMSRTCLSKMSIVAASFTFFL